MNHRQGTSARSTPLPRQLRRLYRTPKSSQEFEPALDEFFESSEHENIVDNLRDAALEEFIDFLDKVLQIEGLSRDLFQKALYDLWIICGKWRVLPRSSIISRGLSRSSEKEFASGGYANVWKGELVKGLTSRRVCIKAIKVTVRDGEVGRSDNEKAFYEEASVWMRLKHPNVVQCLGATTNPTQVVMDLMSNGEVLDYMKTNRNADRAHLVLGLTEGLDYLHSRGVIHGDLKPQNILVNARGDACISDFGLAIVISGGRTSRSGRHTARGHSSLWAAPETLHDARISKEADVFSYGLVAIEIFKGESPWGRATGAQIMAMIAFGEHPARPEGSKALGLTTELWNRLTRCWQRNPKDRITISEVLRFLHSTSWKGRVGASKSEVSIGGTTVSGTVGAKKSASILHPPSSVRDYQQSDLYGPQPTGGSSNHRSGPVGLPEKIGPHPETASVQGGGGAQIHKGFWKRVLCLPSCISAKGVAA